MKKLWIRLALATVVIAPGNVFALPDCKDRDYQCYISQANNDLVDMPQVWQPTIVRIYAKAFERYNLENPKDTSNHNKEYWQRRFEEAKAQGLENVRSRVQWYSNYDTANESTRDYLETYLPTAAYYLVTIKSYQQSLEELLTSASASSRAKIQTSIKAIDGDLQEIAKLVRYNGAWNEQTLHDINDRAYKSYSDGNSSYRSETRSTPSGSSSSGNTVSFIEAAKRCNRAYPTAKFQGGDQAGHKACMKMLGY